jgi:beta-glucanase (GH16 family)
MRRIFSLLMVCLVIVVGLIMVQGCTAARASDPATATATPTKPGLRRGSAPVLPTPSPTPADPANLPTVPGGFQPYAVSGSWRLVLNDNFEGTALDTGVWQPNWFGDTLTSVTQYVNSLEGQCFDPAQLRVANGSLNITAVRKDCPDTSGKSAGFPITSGMINSYKKFSFVYGVAEARMWVEGPDENHCNNWASFWLNGMPGDGRQEYDIAECLGGQFEFHLNPQNVFGGSSTSEIANGWHVFSIEWMPDGVTVFYDRTLIGSINDDVYSKPMYLIVENAVAADGESVVPTTMRVDYIRVWQAAQ